MNYIRRILARVRRADLNFNLIEEGDRICVGISGGKDSSLLLYSLIYYRMYAKKNFEIIPIILNLGFDQFNPTPLIEFFKKHGVEILVEDASTIYPILKANQQDGKHLPCSICSRMKKAAINQAAHKHNCNKVAFGHHYDDALETLLLNTIYGGRLATFDPKMHLDRENIIFIRPLVLAREDEIKGAQRETGIPIVVSGCPADKTTRREDMKNDLKSVFKKYEPSYRNLENMLINERKSGLWFDRVVIGTENLQIEKVINRQQSFVFLKQYEKEINGELIYNDEDDYFNIKKDNEIIGTMIIRVVSSTNIALVYLTKNLEKEFDKFKIKIEEYYHFTF